MECQHVPNESSAKIDEKDIITLTQTVLQYGTAPIGKYELSISTKYPGAIQVSYITPDNLRIDRGRILSLKIPHFFWGMNNQTKQHLINKIKVATRMLNTATEKYFERQRVIDSIKQTEEV